MVVLASFYERLRSTRVVRGLTQEELARAMGWGERSNVSRLESGKHIPRADTLVQLCQVLNVSADYLLGLKDNHVPFCDNE